MSTKGIVDTQGQTVQVKVPGKRRRTIQERRQIVEETFLPNTSVSRVARRYDVNANQLFYWRKLYREGRLGGGVGAPLLPVKLSEELPEQATKCDNPVRRKRPAGRDPDAYVCSANSLASRSEHALRSSLPRSIAAFAASEDRVHGQKLRDFWFLRTADSTRHDP